MASIHSPDNQFFGVNRIFDRNTVPLFHMARLGQIIDTEINQLFTTRAVPLIIFVRCIKVLPSSRTLEREFAVLDR